MTSLDAHRFRRSVILLEVRHLLRPQNLPVIGVTLSFFAIMGFISGLTSAISGSGGRPLDHALLGFIWGVTVVFVVATGIICWRCWIKSTQVAEVWNPAVCWFCRRRPLAQTPAFCVQLSRPVNGPSLTKPEKID